MGHRKRTLDTGYVDVREPGIFRGVLGSRFTSLLRTVSAPEISVLLAYPFRTFHDEKAAVSGYTAGSGQV